MEKKINKNTLQEVFIIFNKLDLFNVLPEKLKDFILVFKNDNHQFDFNMNRPLLEQINDDSTRFLVSYIHYNFISKKDIDIKKFIDEIKENFENGGN